MKVSMKKEDARLTIAVSGRLETRTAPALEKAMLPKLNDVREVVFDFEKLDYISSAGLRVVIVAMQTMRERGRVKVRSLKDEVREVFELTGLLNVLEVEE